MALKLYFNAKTFESAAKEFRRASWGAAAASAAVGYQQNSGLALLFGGAAWFALQSLAIVLESVRDEKGDKP